MVRSSCEIERVGKAIYSARANERKRSKSINGLVYIIDKVPFYMIIKLIKI